jgi:hypothetical protein
VISDDTKGRIAAAIDEHLEGHHMGLFFDPNSTRPWWWLLVVKQHDAWTLQRGRWEFVIDRPGRVQRIQVPSTDALLR